MKDNFMDNGSAKLARRELPVITCRPDDGQDSTASEVLVCVCFGFTRTEARVAVPTKLQSVASERGWETV